MREISILWLEANSLIKALWFCNGARIYLDQYKCELGYDLKNPMGLCDLTREVDAVQILNRCF